MMSKTVSVWLLAIVFSSCAVERASDPSGEVATPQISDRTEPSLRQDPRFEGEPTFGELLKRIGELPEGEPTFPCSIDLKLKSESPSGLKKFRTDWMRREDDSRYRVVRALRREGGRAWFDEPCVCPGVCVVVLQDRDLPEPENDAVLIIDRAAMRNGPIWAARGINLSEAQLSWSSSTPHFQFGEP